MRSPELSFFGLRTAPFTKGSAACAASSSRRGARRRRCSVASSRVIHAEEQLLVYRRATAAEVVNIAINAGGETVEVRLEDDEAPAMEPLLVVGEAAVEGQAVMLGPRVGVALRRVTRSARTERMEGAQPQGSSTCNGVHPAVPSPS